MNWNSPFVWFLIFVTIIAGGIIVLCRKAIVVIGRQITAHAKVNTRSYVRGAIYVSVAVLSDFKEIFGSLGKDTAEVMPWWSWLVIFSTPILGGLITLGAYLDNTSAANRAAPPQTNKTHEDHS